MIGVCIGKLISAWEPLPRAMAPVLRAVTTTGAFSGVLCVVKDEVEVVKPVDVGLPSQSA
jgi:hypothetical protein